MHARKKLKRMTSHWCVPRGYSEGSEYTETKVQKRDVIPSHDSIVSLQRSLHKAGGCHLEQSISSPAVLHTRSTANCFMASLSTCELQYTLKALRSPAPASSCDLSADRRCGASSSHEFLLALLNTFCCPFRSHVSV